MKVGLEMNLGNTVGREVGGAGRDSAVTAGTCQEPDSARQGFWCVIGKGHLGRLLWNYTSVGLP